LRSMGIEYSKLHKGSTDLREKRLDWNSAALRFGLDSIASS